MRNDAGRAGRLRRGFTLLELMTVVGIIMVLMGIAVVSTRSIVDRMRVNQARLEIERITIALEQYEQKYKIPAIPMYHHPQRGRVSFGGSIFYETGFLENERGPAVAKQRVATQADMASPGYVPGKYIHRSDFNGAYKMPVGDNPEGEWFNDATIWQHNWYSVELHVNANDPTIAPDGSSNVAYPWPQTMPGRPSDWDGAGWDAAGFVQLARNANNFPFLDSSVGRYDGSIAALNKISGSGAEIGYVGDSKENYWPNGKKIPTVYDWMVRNNQWAYNNMAVALRAKYSGDEYWNTWVQQNGVELEISGLDVRRVSVVGDTEVDADLNAHLPCGNKVMYSPYGAPYLVFYGSIRSPLSIRAEGGRQLYRSMESARKEYVVFCHKDGSREPLFREDVEKCLDPVLPFKMSGAIGDDDAGSGLVD